MYNRREIYKFLDDKGYKVLETIAKTVNGIGLAILYPCAIVIFSVCLASAFCLNVVVKILTYITERILNVFRNRR